MVRKTMLVSAAGGLAALVLSGCVYDAGSFSGNHGDFYGRGVYAGGGLVLGRGAMSYDGSRHHRGADR